MLKKVSFTIIIAAFLLVVVSGALSAQEESQDYYYGILQEYVDLHNNNLEEIPGIVKRIFAKERINFYIARDTGDEFIGVATSDTCEILEFVPTELAEPTILVYINGNTVDELLANPSQTAVIEALSELEIEGVGLFKKIKVAFLKFFIRASGWFL